MVSSGIPLAATVLIAGILLLSGSALADSGIQTTLGNDVPLSGYSSAAPFVYLFLTGPNLPENGVALNDITERADQGGFTKVSVDGNDHWSYTWHTASVGGRLDEGTYTVWVVDGPNDRSKLAEADYRTIDITLGEPFVSVDTGVQSGVQSGIQPGGMDLQSVPYGASIMINGEYRGITPLQISDLTPGSYTVTFSRSGFVDLTTRVPVGQGQIAEVNATLQPETGTLAVNSTPAGARVLLDGADAGLSPVVLVNISADNHTVMLEKDGYFNATQQVRITAGRTNPVEVSLVPVPLSPVTTRSAGLVPAMAGAFSVLIMSIACRHRRTR
jgi:hypothetical protein